MLKKSILLSVLCSIFVSASSYAWNVNDYMPRGPWVVNENSEKVSGYNLDGSTKVTSGVTPLNIHPVGELSTLNSTATTLGSGVSFQGTSEDILNESVIVVAVYSDQASATNGFMIEWSTDGTNWDGNDIYTVAASIQKQWTFFPATQYMRVTYVNGATPQTEFRLQVIRKSTYVTPSSHRIADSISDQDDAELVKAVITGEGPTGIFNNVKTNQEKALSITNFLVEVARDNIEGMKMYSIPARKDNVSTSVLDDFTQIPGTTVYQRPGGIQLEIVSSSGSDDAVGGTGLLTAEIHYLDSSGVEQEETISLDGAAPVDTIATDIADVQWVHSKTVGSAGIAVGNISLRDTSGTTVYEYISAGGNQSLSGRYKVPTGKTGYVIGWQVSGISQKMDIRLRATVERFDRTLIPGVFLFQDLFLANDSASGWVPFEVPLKMPAGAVVKMSGISFNAAGDAGGQFDILLIDD